MSALAVLFFGCSSVMKGTLDVCQFYFNKKQIITEQITKKFPFLTSNMKPIYFCSSCKQYHATCQKNVLTHSNSVKYLRFSDLFNAAPHAHLQNYTFNSPTLPSTGRLVYDTQTPTLRKSRQPRNRIAKQKLDNRSSTNIKESRATFSDKPSTSTQRKHPKNAHTTIHLSIQKQKKPQNLNTTEPINLRGNYLNKTTKNQPQIQKHSGKGPYYVVSKLPPNPNRQKNGSNDYSDYISKNMKTIDTTVISVAQKQRSRNKDRQIDKKTPVKNSFVYGDSNRKILTSETDLAPINSNSQRKQVRQWRFGDLVESRESQGLKKEKNAISKHEDPFQDKERSLLIFNQPGSRLDYNGKMGELRQLLKSNQKNYRNFNDSSQVQKSHLINSQIQGSQLIQLPLTAKDIQIQADPSSQDIEWALHKKNLKNGQHKIKKIEHCQDQKYKCKYFDNRCLGFNMGSCMDGEWLQNVEEGEIGVIRSELL